MVINSSGIMAVCCLIMYQDVISLSGTIMLHYISSLHHIKKAQDSSHKKEHLHPGLPPPLYMTMYKTHKGSFRGSQCW